MLLLMRRATLFSSVAFFSLGVTGAVLGLPLFGSSVRISAVRRQRKQRDRKARGEGRIHLQWFVMGALRLTFVTGPEIIPGHKLSRPTAITLHRYESAAFVSLPVFIKAQKHT
jgi:hypothetical protein